MEILFVIIPIAIVSFLLGTTVSIYKKEPKFTTLKRESLFGNNFYGITKCCGMGPIVNEKYCPGCGKPIKK